VVATTPAPASELARQLGAVVSFDLGAGGFAVQVDERFATAAPRVFACGDVTGYVGPEAAARAGAQAGGVIANAIAAL
jgi:pyruvate/2-oxoglutarate dehydrogenase complex dihydrolipoamide dehydrogenase (E3) component